MGLSQEALAARLGVDRSTVVRWEAATSSPQPFLRPLLADVLGVTVGELDGLLGEPVNHRIDRSGSRASNHANDGPRMDAVLEHLRDQWHLLVKTDNLLGPRHALSGVVGQLDTIQVLLETTGTASRPHVVRWAAQFAESASWLYEDSGALAEARRWASRALEWAIEANDPLMTSWVLFRLSQQALPGGNVAHAIGLAAAARRAAPDLLPSMRAALDQQEATAWALAGDEIAAHRKLDDAHSWAATDTTGDARAGHGSYCTASYIEVQRAHCWLALGHPTRAIELYEATLPTLPVVYRRDRGVALSRLAKAYVTSGQPELAARTAHEAFAMSKDTGSGRTLGTVRAVAQNLAEHRTVPSVAAFLREVSAELR